MILLPLFLITNRGHKRKKNFFNGEMIGGDVGIQRLRLYNFKTREIEPLWADSIKEDVSGFSYIRGQVSDSVIWGSNGDKSFSFWKIGQSPQKIKLSTMYEGGAIGFDIEYMRLWTNGNYIALGKVDAFYGSDYLPIKLGIFQGTHWGREYCEYAIIDPISKKMIYKKLNDSLQWLKKRDDVMVLNNDIVSINVNLKYTMGNNHFWGKIITVDNQICSMERDTVFCSEFFFSETYEREDSLVYYLDPSKTP